MTKKPSRVDPERLTAALDAGREGAAKDGKVTVRAVASIDSNLHMVGRTGRFRLESDEPEARGGTDVAPSPLQYFLAGAAFWLLTQLAKFSPLHEVDLQDAKVDARAEFDVADKYDLPGPGAAFLSVTFDLHVVSDAPKEKVSKLVEHAERACHAEQSLQQPVPTSLRLTHETS